MRTEQTRYSRKEPRLPVTDIADHLGIKQDTGCGWIVRRHMPAHKLGKLSKFKESEIDSWVRSGGALDD